MMASHVDISIRVPLNSSSVDSPFRQSSASPLLHRPSSVPVSTQPLSFSISRILGLEDGSCHFASYSRIPGKFSLILAYIGSVYFLKELIRYF